jgi:uncharacterized protein with ParB-like and HNH nuclease domain
MDSVSSKLYNIQTIINEDNKYNVPRYQRLYVWEEEQVKTLFNDIHTACISRKEIYYIGGIIKVLTDKENRYYDLVDGQQRFTTLWLLANELGDDLSGFVKSKKELRLKFSIRKNVENYFNHLSDKIESNEENDGEFDDLKRISKARKTISNLINENLTSSNKKQTFIKYILRNVKMVITEVPQKTDLNKLFETLNNRGVQLAQHEILKAQILSKITNKQERHRYGIIWNACSDMGSYLERSLSYEIGQSKEIANSYNYWRHDWKYIFEVLKNNKGKENKLLNLEEIISQKVDNIELGFKSDIREEFFHPETGDDEFEKVRSILSFPQLLLHTLRIYLFKNDYEDIQRINEKELLFIFSKYFYDKLDEKTSKKFIELLLTVREAFDKYVIKWVEENENSETHLIKKVYKQNQKKGGWTYYLRRQKTKEYDGLALLQSILYHSQQMTTQYWLTPFLYRMLDFPGFDYAYEVLKTLDNVLFSSNKDESKLPERTIACMTSIPQNSFPNTLILTQEKGTGFPHYWFYKMEFVLWHERAQIPNTEHWSDYKMTARNSIEHISPQNPRDIKDKKCYEMLDRFGNLVLVTRSINSEYSDNPFGVKKAKFFDKKTKGSLDSLKSDLIFMHNEWDDILAKKHEENMIEMMDNYFKKTMAYE